MEKPCERRFSDVFGIRLPEGAEIAFSAVRGWANWPRIPLQGQNVKVTAPGLLPILTGHEVCAKWLGYSDNENDYLGKDILTVARNMLALNIDTPMPEELGAPPDLTTSRLQWVRQLKEQTSIGYYRDGQQLNTRG